MHWLENDHQASAIGTYEPLYLYFYSCDVDCQHVRSIWWCRLGACACWLLTVGLQTLAACTSLAAC